MDPAVYASGFSFRLTVTVAETQVHSKLHVGL